MNVLKQMMIFIISIPAFSYTMEIAKYKDQLRSAYQRFDKADKEWREARAELTKLREGWRNRINTLHQQHEEEHRNSMRPYLKAEEEIYDERLQHAKL